MAVGDISSYVYQAREFWSNKGRPKEMFDRAGTFGKALRKGTLHTFSGKGIAQQAVDFENGGNAGADYATAIEYSGDDTGDQFQIPLSEMWSIIQLNWRFMELTKQPGWGLANQKGEVKKQIARMRAWYKTLSYTVWGDGTGRIIKGDGVYSVAGLVGKCMNRQTVRRLDNKDIIVFVNGNTDRAGELKVKSINRETGEFILEAASGPVITAITDAIPGAANTDYIAKKVDRAAVNSGNIMLGFYSWVPRLYATAVTPFLGVPRDQDVERLAGKRIRLSAGETPWQALQLICDRASTEGIPIDTVCIPHHLWMTIENEWRGFIAASPEWMYRGGNASTLSYGFGGLKYTRPGMDPIMVTSDIYLNDPAVTEDNDRTYVGMRMADWDLITTPTGINWWDMTGTGKLQQIQGSQQVLGSYGMMGNLKTEHPGHNIVAGPDVTVS